MATVSRLSNTGIMYTSGELDEVSNNLTAQGSILFNGSSACLNVPNSAELQFGTGDFTIEMWMFFNSTSSASQPLNFYTTTGAGGDECYSINVAIGGAMTYNLSSTGATFNIATGVSMGSAVGINRWYHIALVRSGSVFTPYINGVAGTTTTSSASLYATTSNLYIGAYYNGSSTSVYYSGLISNLRIVKGVAVYTGAFTPQTTPLQKTQIVGTNIAAFTNTANTSLLLSGLYNNPFKDISDNNFAVTLQNVVATSTSLTEKSHPFNFDGYYSNKFDSAFKYMTVPANIGFTFGTGDFTVETWIYMLAFSGSGTAGAFVGPWSGTASTSAWLFTQGNLDNSTLRFGWSDGSSVAFVESSTGALQLNQWIHIAAVRTSGTLKLYSNGLEVYSGALTTNISVSSQALQINGVTGATFLSNCFYSNLRIVKGIAVYTGAFTPSTKPLTAIQPAGTNIAAITGNSTVFTSLLTCQSKTFKDNGANNFTITLPTGSAIPIIYSNTVPFPSMSYANTGLPISKQYSNGLFQTTGSLDEISLNPNLSGSVSLSGALANWVSVPRQPNFKMTGDFTVEGWFLFPTAYTSIVGNPVLIDNYLGTTTSVGNWRIEVSGGGVYFSYDGNIMISAVAAIKLGVWFHVAAVRVGTYLALYINGVQVGSTTYTGFMGRNDAPITIGASNEGNGAGLFTGNFGNIRIVNGIGVYTGAFTPPTKPLSTLQPAETNIAAITDITKTVLLLRTTKNDVYDLGINKLTVKKNPLATSVTAPANYLASSVNPYEYLNGNGYYGAEFGTTSTYFTMPYNSGYGIPAGQQFCLEGWVYRNLASGTSEPIMGWNWTYGTNGGTWSIEYDTNLMFKMGMTGTGQGGASVFVISSIAAPINQWNHFCITRNSLGAVRMFVNGILSAYYFTALTTGSGQALTAASGSMYVGKPTTVGAAAALTSIISNIRFVNGEIPSAYVTSSATISDSIFAPPQTPLTNVSNTKFLICQSSTFVDNSSTGLTITNTGATIATINPFVKTSPPTIVSNTILRKQFNDGSIQIINNFDDYTSIA